VIFRKKLPRGSPTPGHHPFVVNLSELTCASFATSRARARAYAREGLDIEQPVEGALVAEDPRDRRDDQAVPPADHEGRRADRGSELGDELFSLPAV
jgi:hypothetical protein